MFTDPTSQADSNHRQSSLSLMAPMVRDLREGVVAGTN